MQQKVLQHLQKIAKKRLEKMKNFFKAQQVFIIIFNSNIMNKSINKSIN